MVGIAAKKKYGVLVICEPFSPRTIGARLKHQTQHAKRFRIMI
jgi:hypothetical protein